MSKNIVLGFVIALIATACGGGDRDKDDGLDCASAFICASDCKTDTCIEKCMDDATPAAKSQMIDLATCSEQAGCDEENDAEACLRESCADELHACGGIDGV